MLLLSLAFLFAVLAYVFSLYRAPVEAVGYALTLSVLPIIIIEVFRYFQYKRKLRALEQLLSGLDEHSLELPETGNAIEQAYQRLTLEIDRRRKAAITKLDRANSERMDYYTLWAHQIKTPIAAMRLLLQATGETDLSQLKAQLFHIEQYVELAMGYQKMECGLTDLVLRQYPLDDVIRQALKKNARLFSLKKLTLHYEPTGITVLTDERWLCFVIEQILSNAIKYTNKGGIRIEKSGVSTLMIQDTGIGIEPSDLPRICEKGYTGYNGRADHKSTGIGLYLCKRIMDKLGHGLRFESEVDRGTSVYLLLSRRSMTLE